MLGVDLIGNWQRTISNLDMVRLAIDAVTRFTAKRRAHTVRPYEGILTPNYFPVDPNPPSPRSVSFRVAVGTKAACHTGAIHSWATRSPGAMV